MDRKWDELYAMALTVKNERRISELVTAGEVAAAVEAESGRIYTGVCVDTCAGLGLCAERNAIFNMITNGESRIKRVLAVMPDGKLGPPCGACRELMAELMPEDYRSVEILLDKETGRIVTLGELLPDWWA